MSAYNGEKYLAQAIESILGQTFAGFEFIIINDGSTDCTATIIDTYTADPRIISVHNRLNMGLTRSLNHGLALAQGDYVARMDADDISHPDRLARQVSFLDAHPEVGVVGSWVQAVDAAGHPVQVWQFPHEPGFVAWCMYFQNPIAHPTVAMRRAVVKELGGYNDNIAVAQDYDLWWRLRWVAGLANLPEVLVNLRVHPDSISADRRAQQLKVCLEINQRMMSKALNRDVLPQVVKQLWRPGYEKSEVWPQVKDVFEQDDGEKEDFGETKDNRPVGKLIYKLCKATLDERGLPTVARKAIRTDAAHRLLNLSLPCLREDGRLWEIVYRAGRLDPALTDSGLRANIGNYRALSVLLLKFYVPNIYGLLKSLKDMILKLVLRFLKPGIFYTVTLSVLPALGGFILLVMLVTAWLNQRFTRQMPVKKSLLFYTTYLYERGGSEHQLSLLALELKRRGYEPVIFSEQPVAENNIYYRTLTDAGIRVVTAHAWLGWLRRLYEHLFRHNKLPFGLQHNSRGLAGLFFRLVHAELTFYNFLEKPKLIHIYRGPGFHAIRWAKCAGLPAVYAEMGTPVPEIVFWMGLQFTINEAAAIITLSQAGAEALRNSFGATSPIEVIPTMIEEPLQLSQPLREGKPGVLIGCSGRLSEEKGHSDLVKAAAQVLRVRPDVQFLITGDGPLRPRLEALTQELGLERQVSFLGFIDDAQFPAFLAQLDIFVLPSLMEGMPIIILEAMAYGKPVVATAVGGVPELIQDGLSGLLVPAQRSDLLAEAILRLIDDEKLRLSMGMAGCAQYKQHFSRDAVVEQTLAVYARVS